VSRQREERRLECIVRGVFIAKSAATDAQDHRPMTVHQGLEGRLAPGLSALGEPFQQLPVCQPAEHTHVKQGAQVSQAGPVTPIDHETAPDARVSLSTQ
jgi:hypothetical protein